MIQQILVFISENITFSVADMLVRCVIIGTLPWNFKILESKEKDVGRQKCVGICI